MNQEPIPVERVRGSVRRAPPPPSPGAQPEAPVQLEDGDHEHRPLTAGDAVPVVTVGLVGFFSGEIVVSALAGLAALGALALRRLAIRERFGFGDGFTPFRSDMGWPQGVQEDDDFHWSWSGTPDETAPVGRRPIAH
jgi:hypothetical protein